jgi:hypothetical protein
MKNSMGIDSIVLVRDASSADAARLGLFLVRRRLQSEDLLLVGPDQRPHVEQHDRAEPRSDAECPRSPSAA